MRRSRLITTRSQKNAKDLRARARGPSLVAQGYIRPCEATEDRSVGRQRRNGIRALSFMRSLRINKKHPRPLRAR